MECSNDAFDRIVEQNRTNTDSLIKLEVIVSAEKRLVSPGRLALVIKDKPAASYPAKVGVASTVYLSAAIFLFRQT